jgi:hypothetical protein
MYRLEDGTDIALEDATVSATAELEDWLENTSEKVRRNVTIETPESLGVQHLLHISTDTNIRQFVPLIGRRQAPSEDRTVPRVCVCPHLLGCILGYADAVSDFHADGAKQNDAFKGGWKIYGLSFDAALKPNSKLVYDAIIANR